MKSTRSVLLLILTSCLDPNNGETADTGGEPCDSRGQATLDVGTGGPDAFSPFADMAPISAVSAETGFYSLRLELRTTGMDTGPMATTVQVELGGTYRDTVGDIAMHCQDDGVTGFGVVFAALPEPAGTDPFASGGQSIEVDVNVRDVNGADDHEKVSLVLAAR